LGETVFSFALGRLSLELNPDWRGGLGLRLNYKRFNHLGVEIFAERTVLYVFGYFISYEEEGEVTLVVI
jgi:hypothetical protein